MNTFIRTFYLNAKNNPEKADTIVFLHGFGGSSATYHRMMSNLSQDLNVYFFDWLGMGCSGRPPIPYEKFTARQVIDLFVDSVRQTILGLNLDKKEFHLSGHSFGAYISCFYLLKYSEGVKTFAAVSCAGTTTEPSDFRDILKKKKLPFKRRAFVYFWQFMNKGFVTGRTVFTFSPLEWIMHHWTVGRLEFEGKEKETVIKYLAEMFRSEDFSCEVLPKIFGFRTYAFIPVIDIMQELSSKVKTVFVYGDQDWLDKHTFQKELKESRL